MSKRHVVAAAVLIGIGAALGTYAVTRTSELGASSRVSSKKAADATVTVRTRKLDALETSLRKALASKPPALPKVPKLRPAPQPTTRVVYSAAPAPTSRVVVRSAEPVRSTRAAASSASHGEQDHQYQPSGSRGEHDD
ncbi:MAG: hypothetical protein ABSB96_11105 [Gaiellaceae bacterium]